MNLREAFWAINHVAQNTYNDDTMLTLNGNEFYLEHKGRCVKGPFYLWQEIIDNGLTTKILKPIAEAVLKDYLKNMEPADYPADYSPEWFDGSKEEYFAERNDILEQNKRHEEWARKELGELLT